MNKSDLIVESPLKQKSVDLVVGIPSYNEADNIAFVAEQAAAGLDKYFPDARTAVINADNFSKDGTKQAFLGADTDGIPKVYLSTPQGVTGKGNNFYNLFRYLAPFEPKAIIVVDADLKSIRPDWIQLLAQPVLEGFSFVSPAYARNEYDGTITNHICYPLLYGLLGHDIRQPIGGDFAFSGELMNHWLDRTWSNTIRQYGIDIFMTLEAILSGYPMAQVSLGAKIHKPSAPKLGMMFTQVVDTLFSRLQSSRQNWRLKNGKPMMPPLLNAGEARSQEPQDLGIDYKALKRQAMDEFSKRSDLIRKILPLDHWNRVEEMFQQRRFRLSRRIWTEIVFCYLRAHAETEDHTVRYAIVESLKPLYFGRVVSFIRETLEMDHQESEQQIIRQAQCFWRHRRKVVRP